MPQPKIIVTLDLGVGIDPIPTGAGGIVRGPTITVKGTAECKKETIDEDHPENNKTEDSPGSITKVEVRFGPSGAFVKANPTGPVSTTTHLPTWTTWTTGPRNITGFNGNTLQITARVSAGTGAQAVQDTATVTAAVDRTPPDLTITTGLDMRQEVVNGETTFTLKGAASDPDNLSPVAAVEWVLGQGQQFTMATPKGSRPLVIVDCSRTGGACRGKLGIRGQHLAIGSIRRGDREEIVATVDAPIPEMCSDQL